MTKAPLVLVVDDEAEIRANLRSELESQGYACEEASTADTALSLASSFRPELVLLDLGLPDRDGLHFLKEFRLLSQAPVIVVSARGGEGEKVAALEAGADDYLTKPFGAAELVARLRAVLRRSGSGVVAAAEVVRIGPLRWDRTARRVFLGDGEVHLTPVEYRLFAALARQRGRILTHRTLLAEVWGREAPEVLHYVRIAVAGLRRKLEPTEGSPRLLHTEVGVGYRLSEAFDEPPSSSRPPNSTT